MIRGFFYRVVMKAAHRYHWHYAPPIYPDGDTQLWCKWCGLRQTIKRRSPDTEPDWVKNGPFTREYFDNERRSRHA